MQAANGHQDEFIATRIRKEYKDAIRYWVDEQDEYPTMSALLRHLIEVAVEARVQHVATARQ